MIKWSELRERCWPGYKSVPGKKAYTPGSCVKESSTIEEDLRKWFSKTDPKGGWKRIVLCARHSINSGGCVARIGHACFGAISKM